MGAETERQPLLFYKVGGLGAAPLGFDEAFAREFSAAYFSSNSIRQALISRHEAEGMPETPIESRYVNKELVAQAAPILTKGSDVVVDMCFNSPNSRRRTPIQLARRAGALPIALSIRAPKEVIEARVQQWTEEDTLGKPLADWTISPLAVVDHGLRSVVWPDLGKEQGLAFRLDGSGGVDDIIGQIEERLIRQGLADPAD